MRRLLLEAERIGLSEFGPALMALVADLEAKLAGSDAQARMLREAFEALPDIRPSSMDFSGDFARVGVAGDLPPEKREAFFQILKALIPWRKGPFSLFGVDIDTEWRSSMKWDRVRPVMAPLEGRRILDIGASNGYYLFRMAPEKPSLALGIEPFLPYYYQFQLVQQYASLENLFMLPAGFEALPAMPGFFDTVFCMGVLYHRRSPVTFLQELRPFLREGGELVLETLVVAGEEPVSHTPLGRYAKMRHIYFLPTVNCLSRWLSHAGFEDVRCVDLTYTSLEEQRKTAWAFDESLEDFLDPINPGRTIEGEPAPLRALVLARAGQGGNHATPETGDGH